jgi:hypothetical protein
MKAKLLGLVACMALFGVSHAAATTYTYTGNDFTNVTSPFTTSDSISGTLTFATPLGPNLSNQAVTPTSFSFTDGEDTFTNLNATGTLFINFYTNSAGVPTHWYIVIDTANAEMFTNYNHNGNAGDEGAINFTTEAYNSQDPGSFSVSTTPLPAALPLFATGLGAMGLLGWRRKRKASDALTA